MTSNSPVRAQLQRLHGDAELLASRLEQSAEALLRIGAPPEPALARDLRQFDGELKAFLSDGLRITANPPGNLWESLEASVRRQEQRTVVAPQLRTVLALRHRSQDTYEPLDAVRRDAADWLQRLDGDGELPGELIDALLSGRHAALALVRLATQPGTLSDSDWVADQNLISELYGRTLALAAARGQLQVERETPTLVAPAPPQRATPPIVVTRTAPTAPPVATPRIEPADQVTPPLSTVPPPESRSVAHVTSPTRVSEVTAAPQGLAEAARRTLAAAGAARRRELSDLIWRLLQHDRTGLAWQLNRSAESLYGGGVAPGMELVRGAALGLALPAPGGALARALSRWLTDFALHFPAAQATRWSVPQRRLLTAGLLPAAVCTPDVNALPLLQQIAADDPELARLVERIAAAQTSPTGAPEHGGPAADGVPLPLLQQQVREWQARWSQRSVEFTKAEALFTRRHWSVRTCALQRSSATGILISGWLYTLRLGAGLTTPILTDSADKSEVRRTLSRIDSRLLVGSRNDYPAGTEAVIVPDEAMRTYLQEAAQWARRWLQGPSATTEAGAVSFAESQRRNTELRDQLAEYRSRVNRDTALRDNPADEAARHCLLRSLQSVIDRLDGATAPALLEPDADELLGGELRSLRISNIGPHAVPTCSDAVLIERLLAALAQETSAPAARTSGPQRAAEAVPDPAAALAEAAAGMTLEEELNTMAAALESAAEAGLISDRDHAGLSARLCAVWNGSETLTDGADRDVVLGDLRRRLAARGVGYQMSGASVVRAKPPEESPPVAGGSLLLDEEPL